MKTFKQFMQEHIVKSDGKYKLVSKKTGKNLGTYPTKAGAEKRERQVQYFKHQHEESQLDEMGAGGAGGGGASAVAVTGPTNVTGPQSATDPVSATAVDMTKRRKKYPTLYRKVPK